MPKPAPEVVKTVPLETPPGPDTTKMSKAEFREKIKTFKNLSPGFGNGLPWNGVNTQQRDILLGYRAANFKADDFYKAFGNPKKTKTAGNKTAWYWDCKDGTLMVLQMTTPRSEDVEFIGVNDE